MLCQSAQTREAQLAPGPNKRPVPHPLYVKAVRCRRLADAIGLANDPTRLALLAWADQLEAEAATETA